MLNILSFRIMLLITLLVLCAFLLVRDRNPFVSFVKQHRLETDWNINLISTDNEPREVVNNSGALEILSNFEALFNATTGKPSVQADPNKPETITTWWQAAAMIDWFYNAPVRHRCKEITPVGNYRICQDEPYTVKPPCLVYSFGIHWDFFFDNAMMKLGCEVHSFDPSMNQVDHYRGNNSFFHNIGLSHVDSDAFVARFDVYVSKEQVWKMRTVKSIKKELGHENRVIDVFKMDVEAYEWAVLENMMNTGVLKDIRQVVMEYHLFPKFPPKEDYISLYKIVTRFREMGFREFLASPYAKNKLPTRADIGYVNAYFQ